MSFKFGDRSAIRFEEYRKHDAVSLAGLIAKRQVSAEEVLKTAIARAEQVNPAINAIVHKRYEQARKAVAAGLPKGPLKGLPSQGPCLLRDR
jgi:amidase